MDSSEGLSDGEDLNTAKCPLCGEPNQCALAADPNATECWCDSVTFPNNLLVQISDDGFRKACVCQKCLAQFDDSIYVSDGNQ